MKSNRKIVVLDFDGVVCDSTKECLVTSWNAWKIYHEKNEFRTKISEFSIEEVSNFKKLRYYVKGAGEYYVLRKILEDDRKLEIKNFRDFNLLSKKFKNEINNFKNFIFQARETLRQKSLDDWIKLHDVHEKVVDVIKTCIESKNIYIATLKDLDSVKLILQKEGINFPEEKIFHQELIKSKIEALTKISTLEKKDHSDILFFDDVVDHLVIPFDNGFNVYQTSWGNVPSDYIIEAQKRGIPLANLDSLANLCISN